VAGKGRSKQKQQKHDHPGGSGAVLGVRVMRNSSVQAISLGVANGMQLVSILVVAAFLGPSEMARFGLLTFLAGLVTQIASLLVKPGTVRRTFGGGDDDDDDDDDDDVVSSSPPHTLGAGLAWAIALGVLSAALIYVFRRPIADGLLGDPETENLVALSGLLAGATLVFKICDITLWLERRPGAFLIADTGRPILGLVVLTAFLATGSGVEGAILGTLVGTAVAGAVGLVLLAGSFEPNFDLGEIKQIILRGRYRAPIVMSFWLIQNADIFILSRFVDHSELGIYHLASRLGLVVSLLPQGFRMGMRPLRKSALWDAFQDQYGKQVAGGQLLAYFSLVCILAVLAMVMAGQVLVDAAPASYNGAAALLPFTAIGFVMPPLYRTINQNVAVPNKRPFFIGGVVLAAVLFIGVTWALVGAIGVYAAPVGMIVGFGIPALFLFLRGQRGKKPLFFPYRQIGTAVLLGAAIVGVYEALPEYNHWLELVTALAFCLLWMVLLIPFRAVPEQHWKPLIHMVRSFRSGTPADFRPRRGLRSIEPEIREELRQAVVGRLPLERLEEGDEAEQLVAALRRVGNHGGVPSGKPTELDAQIGVYLFAHAASTAVRNARMRRLLEAGEDAHDLRSLDDLVTTLSRVPVEAWEDKPVKHRGHRGRRRRAAAQLRERASEG
jgi:O-antigen/teichoic acid export membrane protein